MSVPQRAAQSSVKQEFGRRVQGLLSEFVGRMDADEKAIVDYLKTWPGQFVSGREISRRAGGKWRYRDNPEWASSLLPQMVEQGLLESDSTGHYRLVKPKEGKAKPKKWVSPQLRKILEQSGKNFGEVLSADDNEDFYTDR